MFDYIKGTLVEMTEVSAIIDINGVGYDIICANPFDFERLIGQSVKIYTHFHVREDAQILYGFKSRDEKTLFKKILNVSGIGPKGALSIVGQGEVDLFVQAIEEENEKYLTGFPGVGKKTARQMILDLKGKLPFMVSKSDQDNKSTGEANPHALVEAKEALKALGYKEREIKAIEPQLRQAKEQTTDALIRKGLMYLTQ
ncbi:Holliday junction ATP-dependent DNA helicase RuvA [Halolactibacillus miurensis]|uniref:Holliday junction branch migration complex subunit RuvA n=1 Tax=Halolactibacillus miurensis TaxID=306541 RepID=A0A1I6PKI6_9BACI|nr:MULTISPECIES: Holliday junction branch migration protein RuvA [Halolactibacillus]GEM03786.1 Holliday junction ATP-dependent DNA helicase RuvA [Halolactibacillus miurensis]SFS40686.1 holliday junction DNA helicase RuvA [Halolactibacillus miurensis]